METAVHTEYKNILIIKPSALGDVVHALPVLSPVKAKFPDAKITWLVRKEFAPLIENHPAIDNLIIFDRKTLANWWRSPAAFKELMSFFKTLKSGSYDLVLDLQGLFRTALFAKITGCKKIIGMYNAREFATLFYTDSITPPQSCHIVDYYIKILKSLAIDVNQITYDLPVSDAAQQQAANIFAQHNITKDNYIVFLPGSAQAIKCWPAEKYAKLADMIREKTDASILALGSASESEQVRKIISLTNSKIINLAGQTKIPELAALLKNAKLVISNDTGPGHIAFALSTPTIFIFGPSNPQRVAPYQGQDSVIAIEPDKRGTDYKSFAPLHKIDNITVEMVFEKVLEKL